MEALPSLDITAPVGRDGFVQIKAFCAYSDRALYFLMTIRTSNVIKKSAVLDIATDGTLANGWIDRGDPAIDLDGNLMDIWLSEFVPKLNVISVVREEAGVESLSTVYFINGNCCFAL